ncbi:MAG: hypothetical protein QME75_10110 [Deltaproteobacteria bacterium]|nr:hypothetical protein [Deltaproteobacteria bacterium]
MSSYLPSILPLIAWASVILAFLLWYLLKNRSLLAKILLLYFSFCLTFIILKLCLPTDLGTYDAKLYQSLATAISLQLSHDFPGNLPRIFYAYSAYTVPLGFLYFIFGPSEPLGQLFSTVLGLGVLYNVHRLTLACYHRQAANLAVLWVALYPYGWVIATTLNRDMPIAFFITLLFRLLAEALSDCPDHKCGKAAYIKGIAGVVYLTLLRPPLLVLCGLTLGVSLLIKNRGLFRSLNVFKPLKAILLAVLILATFSTIVWNKDRLNGFELTRRALQFTSIDNLNLRLESSEDADSAYLPGLRYGSVKDLILTLPLATCYFMYSPLPWQVRSPKQALGLIDSALLLLLTFYFLKGMPELYRRRRKLALLLLIFVVLGFGSSSLLQCNVGAAMRHRTMFFILMVPAAAHAFLNPSRRLAAAQSAAPVPCQEPQGGK